MFQEGQQNENNKGAIIYAIVGVMVLIIAVAGSAYAYYSATAQDASTIRGTAGGGAAPTLNVSRVSTTNGNLVPIDMNPETLTNGAKGWNTTSNAVNTAWNASQACTDKNGYTVCQIYSVTVNNNSTTPVSYKLTLSALAGSSSPDNTPNIDAVKMVSNVSVTDATSIKGLDSGICTTNNVSGGGTSAPCYFMVFVKNLDSAQTDSGAFVGTVTAVGSNGAEVKAQFS